MRPPRKLPKYREARRTRKTQRSELEEELFRQMSGAGVPHWIREYRFCAQVVGMGPGIRGRLREAGLKDWRFDFAWPGSSLAIEVDGGAYVQGGHNRGEGFSKDLQKQHHAAMFGWYVYRCDAELIHSGRALEFIEFWFAEKGRGSDAGK